MPIKQYAVLAVLHTPMTIVERHGHAAESFPSTTEDLPCGTDATVSRRLVGLKSPE